MPELLFAGGAVMAGAVSGAAIVVAAGLHLPVMRITRPPRLDAAHRRLQANIRKAGWSETPERLAALACARAAVVAALALSSGMLLGASTSLALVAAGALAAIGW